MRAIVSEMPEDLPFHICDEHGNRHKGIYAIGLLIWNRGNQPIVKSDLLPSAPLRVKIGDDATLVEANAIAVEDEANFSTVLVDGNTLEITFDCVKPKDYLQIPLIVIGNPMVEIKVQGWIAGQIGPIDHTAEEVQASLGERVACIIGLVFLANAVPGVLIGGWLILKDYGISALLYAPKSIPLYLHIPFNMGLMVLFMFTVAGLVDWNARRKVPEGYPLHADFEPPLLENVKGMLRTVFKGEKIRISASLFDWGKPILLRSKKTQRRTVNDWIQ